MEQRFGIENERIEDVIGIGGTKRGNGTGLIHIDFEASGLGISLIADPVFRFGARRGDRRDGIAAGELRKGV